MSNSQPIGQKSNLQYIDIEKRTAGILASKPSQVSLDDLQFISHVLANAETKQFFFRHAKALDWLFWLDSEGGLKPIFGLEPADSQSIHQLSRWIAHTYLPQFESEVFEIVLRHLQSGGHIRPEAWRNLAWHFAYGKESFEPNVLARWVQLLLVDSESARGKDSLEQILLKCRQSGNEDTAILILDHLTRPKIKWQESLSRFLAETEEEKKAARKFSVEIEIEGSDYWINQAWKGVFQKRLNDYAERLLPIFIRQFETAYLTLRSTGDAGDNWDPVSYSRSAIEPHEQNSGYGALDPLVDYARESMDWLLEHKLEIAEAYLKLLLKSPSLLLQRLGIYTLMQHPKRKADRKIKEILNRNWLYYLPHHHEVYQLLRKCYPETTTSLRKELLSAVNVGAKYPRDDEETRRARDHSIYSMSRWLAESDPACKLAGELFETIIGQHPEFAPSEHPDLTHWSGAGRSGYESPKTIDELSKISPIEAAGFIHNFKGDQKGSLNELQEGLYRVAQYVVKSNPDWGLDVLDSLRKFEGWAESYWSHLIYGFREATLTEEQWGRLLTILNELPKILPGSLHPLADLLAEGGRRKDAQIPETHLGLAEDLALGILDHSEQNPTGPTVFGQSVDWMNRAINHPVGKVTEFWMDGLIRTIKASEPKRPYIPDKYKEIFERIVKSPTANLVFGIPVIFQQLSWLYALDAGWTREFLLPLLDWDRNDPRTMPAWNGYFYSRRWTQALLDDMLPFYEKSFSLVRERLGSHMRSICYDIATITLYGQFNPLTDHNQWLLRFIKESDPEARATWTREIGQLLEHMQADEKTKQWNVWIKEYWGLRNDGKPCPLEAEELTHQVDWAFHLEPAFAEAVDMLLGTRPQIQHDHHVFYRLAEKDEMKIYPVEPLARLISHLLAGYQGQFWSCDYLTKIFNYLLEGRAPHDVLRDICNSLSRLGCSNALEMAGRIESVKNG